MVPISAIDPETKVDFYAGNDKSYRNLVPLWKALDGRRGTFYVSHLVHPSDGFKTLKLYHKFCGYNPIVINSYSDLNSIFPIANDHQFIMFETGHEHESRGLLKAVSCFLCDNTKTLEEKKIINSNAEMYFDIDDALVKLCNFLKLFDVKFIDKIGNKSIGIVYMSFGEKALRGVERSISTLRRIGYSYPITIIGNIKQGDRTPKGCNFIKWQGQSPFDSSKGRNFQFRAGRVKPCLCELSPYDYTLYIDADTEYIKPIHEGFELLSKYDLCITQEKGTLGKLYNQVLAGWEINLSERDRTIFEIGDDAENKKFINSGVIFFRKNEKTLKLFSDWGSEWLRFKEWDEQLAFMRAIHKNKINVKEFDIDWNSPHKTTSTIIFHNYGRGIVRSNQ